MNILGISGGVRPGNQDAAAALVTAGVLTAAAEEERFTRIKHAPGRLPEQAIRYCLGEAGLDIRDIDLVVFPGATYQRMADIIARFFKLKFGHAPPVELDDHHRAHAWSAWLTSGLEETLVVTADLSGDSRSTVLYHASGDQLRETGTFAKPDSLGLFFATMTQYLGFDYDNDECKVMALAALGQPRVDLEWFLETGGDGYSLAAGYLDPRITAGTTNPSRQEPLFNDRFVEKIGVPPRPRGQPVTAAHADLAASAQHLLEKALLKLLGRLQRTHPCRNLCLAGGVALNAALNGRLAYCGRLDNLFVQPVANDAGLALGTALHRAFRLDGFRPGRLRQLALGPSYSSHAVEKALAETGLSHTRCRNIEERTARALARGKTVAFFRGRLKMGPRALGNRSILAAPFSPETPAKLNTCLKNRETFQPFAPSVCAEKAAEFFHFPRTRANFEFMVINARARREARARIPAVVHHDGTARVQAARAENVPGLHRVLQHFGEATGTPVLLNTSLNRRGEPIACRPEDALRVYLTSPVDCLAIEDYWLEKNP